MNRNFNNDLLAKIIMDKEGNAHIALDNHQAVSCSTKSMFSLFANPYEFISDEYKNYPKTTKIIFGKHNSLNDILGLTMAQVHSDTSISVMYPALLKSVIDSGIVFPETPLNFKDYLYKDQFLSQKDYFLKMFLDITSQPVSELLINNKVPLSAEEQEMLLSEIINTHLDALSSTHDHCVISDDATDINNTSCETPLLKKHNTPKKKVSVKKYSEIINVSDKTVRNWIRDKKIPFERTNGKIYIDPDTPIPVDGRTCPQKSSNMLKIVDGSSFEAVQKHIEEDKFVSDYIRPYIRSIDEYRFYKKNNYHEVHWSTRKALIIDINPEYFSEELQKTNRQLIMEGKSPVVPGDKLEHYHLHHIGQKSSSPFAIIPAALHTGEKMDKIFHPVSSGENLHTKTFELEKRAFWREYLDYYDKYTKFKSIPFENSKSKNKK